MDSNEALARPQRVDNHEDFRKAGIKRAATLEAGVIPALFGAYEPEGLENISHIEEDTVFGSDLAVAQGSLQRTVVDDDVGKLSDLLKQGADPDEENPRPLFIA